MDSGNCENNRRLTSAYKNKLKRYQEMKTSKSLKRGSSKKWTKTRDSDNTQCSSGDIQHINVMRCSGDTQSRSKKPSKLEKAQQILEEKKREKIMEKERRMRRQKEMQRAMENYKINKNVKHKTFRKSKKGQPVMKDRIELLLKKIQAS